jgi:hypothetical protein
VTLNKSDPLLSPYCTEILETLEVQPRDHIEPPAYADMIFSSFDGDHFGDVNSVESLSRNLDNFWGFLRSPGSSSSAAMASSSKYIKITMLNPQKEQEASNSIVLGGGTYMTYLITTRTNVREFGRLEFIVRRQFWDVVMLADRLAESYRGLFIPPRPDKLF